MIIEISILPFFCSHLVCNTFIVVVTTTRHIHIYNLYIHSLVDLLLLVLVCESCIIFFFFVPNYFVCFTVSVQPKGITFIFIPFLLFIHSFIYLLESFCSVWPNPTIPIYIFQCVLSYCLRTCVCMSTEVIVLLIFSVITFIV